MVSSDRIGGSRRRESRVNICRSWSGEAPRSAWGSPSARGRSCSAVTEVAGDSRRRASSTQSRAAPGVLTRVARHCRKRLRADCNHVAHPGLAVRPLQRRDQPVQPFFPVHVGEDVDIAPGRRGALARVGSRDHVANDDGHAGGRHRAGQGDPEGSPVSLGPERSGLVEDHLEPLVRRCPQNDEEAFRPRPRQELRSGSRVARQDPQADHPVSAGGGSSGEDLPATVTETALGPHGLRIAVVEGQRRYQMLHLTRQVGLRRRVRAHGEREGDPRPSGRHLGAPPARQDGRSDWRGQSRHAVLPAPAGKVIAAQ